jgi:hypothetical protein
MHEAILQGIESEIGKTKAHLLRLEQAKQVLQPNVSTKKKPGRVLSPEARERIATAQRKRWSKAKRSA